SPSAPARLTTRPQSDRASATRSLAQALRHPRGDAGSSPSRAGSRRIGVRVLPAPVEAWAHRERRAAESHLRPEPAPEHGGNGRKSPPKRNRAPLAISPRPARGGRPVAATPTVRGTSHTGRLAAARISSFDSRTATGVYLVAASGWRPPGCVAKHTHSAI